LPPGLKRIIFVRCFQQENDKQLTAMKKVSLKTLLFSFLIIASIASYAYLYSLPTEDSEAVQQGFNTEEKLNEADKQPDNFIFPEVMFVKKLIETGKRLLPAS